jgi:O-antigen ligase
MRQSRDFQVTAGLLAITMAIGGAGDSFPFLEMLLELCALATLGYFVLTRRTWTFNLETRLALAVLGFILMLPLLQLIPLPPQLWHRIPGREAAAQLDQIMGWQVWRPWSLDVEGTIRAFLELLVPAAVFVGCTFLTLQERMRLMAIVVAFALFSALLGIAQLVSAGSLTPYASAHTGYPVGLFVNRNHNAALLLMAIPLTGALAAVRPLNGKSRLPVTLATVSAFVIFSVVVLGTTSRGGLLLLPLALAAGLLLLVRRQSAGEVAVPAAVTLGAAALVVVFNGGVTRTLTRFSSLQDDRLNYWHDIAWAVKHYGLAGTGFGTFVPVFQSAESLESVVPQYINHAHNDYLELFLEGGIPAAWLLLCFLAIVALALVHSSKSGRPAERRLINFGAVAGMLLIMLFSLVDFPLRMLALSGPFALLLAVLLPTRVPVQHAAGRELTVVERTRPKFMHAASRLVALMLLLAASLFSVEAGISARSIMNGHYQEAAAVASWSTRAHEREATSELLRLDDHAAIPAERAIRLSPINAPAIRTLGLLRLEEGDDHAGNRLMEAAAGLGWRDLLTQFWSIDAAERTGEPVKAAQRAEGLFRQGIFLPALQLLFEAQDSDRLSRLLAGMLAQRPWWRPELLHSVGGLSGPSLSRFEEVLFKLGQTPHPATTDEMKPVLQAFASHGRALEAQRLWLELNPALVDNGNFDALGDSQGLLSPAGWRVPSQNRESVTVAVPQSRPGNRALRIGRADWVRIISQDTMLPPGSYSLSYAALEMGPGPVVLRWQFRCQGAKETQATKTQLVPEQGWRSFSTTFTVPARDCLIQRLALKRVDADDRSETWVDSVRIAPAAH